MHLHILFVLFGVSLLSLLYICCLLLFTAAAAPGPSLTRMQQSPYIKGDSKNISLILAALIF